MHRFYLVYFHSYLTFLLLLCTLSYLFCSFALQDAMLTLIAIIYGQYCTCMWQFHIAPLESWVILLAGGSNDVVQDQVQAKIHLYMHIYIYMYVCMYIFATCIYIQMHVNMAEYSHTYSCMQHLGI